MICLVVLLRTSEGIQDCLLYNRYSAPVTFDGEDANLTYWFPLRQSLPDTSASDTDKSHSCPRDHKHCPRWGRAQSARPQKRVSDAVFLDDYIRPKPKLKVKVNKKKETEVDFKVGDQCWINENILFERFVPKPEFDGESGEDEGGTQRRARLRDFYLMPEAQCTILVNGHLASCMMKAASCPRSQRFRRHLFKHLKLMRRYSNYLHFVYPQLDLSYGETEVNVKLLVDIVAVWPEQRIDYAWGWYMNHLLTRRLLLEEAMAWLSTLGGAHSSLGEYFSEHAEKAGKISKQQLKLALTMGDPLTVARCHMFWAYSSLQQGFTAKARVIVRRVYSFAMTSSVWDQRLVNMCLSAWLRLQFLYRQKVARRKKTRAAAAEKQAKENKVSPTRSINASKGVCLELTSEHQTCDAFSMDINRSSLLDERTRHTDADDDLIFEFD